MIIDMAIAAAAGMIWGTIGCSLDMRPFDFFKGLLGVCILVVAL